MTQFVVIDPENVLTFTGSGEIIGIDISEFADTDFLSVALPDFPYQDVVLDQCFLDITSNEHGDFDIGPTDSLAFTSSTSALRQGDCELRFPLSLLATVLRSQITGVRFRIEASRACNFRALAVRAISADWKYAPIDIDTLYNQAKRPVPPSGSLYKASEFPTNSTIGLPTEWPILFRASEPTSSADPRPVDAKVGLHFCSGSNQAATGDVDYAVRFEDQGQVRIPDNAAFDFTGGFTLEAWINPSDNGDKPLLHKWDDTGKGYRLAMLNDFSLYFEWSTDGVQTQVLRSNPVLTENAWHHVVVTYNREVQSASMPLLTNTNGTEVIIYCNGESVAQVSGLPDAAVVATANDLIIAGGVGGTFTPSGSDEIGLLL